MSKLEKGYGSTGLQAILGDMKTYYEGELAKKANASDIPVITGKADKVTNATSGHLAGLDSNGNLTDSGVSPTEEVTIEGNPVTFDSPFEQDAKSVVVSVKPIQDLHGYDHPWPAGGGKNKCPYDNVSFTSANTWCNLEGGAASSLLQGSPVALKADTYYISMPTNVNIDGMQVADANENVLVNSKNGSFTLTTDETIYIRVKQEVASQPTSCKIQIEAGSQATTWTPYSNICPISGTDEVEIGVSDGESAPTTTTLPIPSTLYDGDVDVTNGDADSRFGMIDLGTLTWFVFSSGRFYAHFSNNDNVKSSISTSVPGNIKCTHYKNVPQDVIESNDSAVCIDASNPPFINIMDTTKAAMTVEEFKAAMSGVQLCYELATPTTISFTPTDVELLEGTNVLTTNGEKVTVTYKEGELARWEDVEDYVDAAINKSITKVLASSY